MFKKKQQEQKQEQEQQQYLAYHDQMFQQNVPQQQFFRQEIAQFPQKKNPFFKPNFDYNQGVTVTYLPPEVEQQLKFDNPQLQLFGFNQVQRILNDDEVAVNELDIKQQQWEYEIGNNLDVKMQSLYNAGGLRQDTIQYLPVCIQIQTQPLIQQNLSMMQNKAGIDIICLLDRSQDMNGYKLACSKDAITLLLNFLTYKDRISLIQFDQFAQRLTPLTRCRQSGKQTLLQVIDQIFCSNFNSEYCNAFQLALQQISERKYKKNITMVLLFTGSGDDPSPIHRIQTILSQCRQVFTIHIFAFGQETNSQLLQIISKERDGSFFQVRDPQIIDQKFAELLCGQGMVVAENIILHISVKSVLKNVQIQKTYSDRWETIVDGQQYKIRIPYLPPNCQQNYLFEICLPKWELHIDPNKNRIQILFLEATFRCSQTQKIYYKQASLKLNLFNPKDQIPCIPMNFNVAFPYYKHRLYFGLYQIDLLVKQKNKNQIREIVNNLLAIFKRTPQIEQQFKQFTELLMMRISVINLINQI